MFRPSLYNNLQYCLSLSDANYLSRCTKDAMQRELLANLYRAEELDDLLRESEFTIRRRKECQRMVESLGKASEIVSQVQ